MTLTLHWFLPTNGDSRADLSLGNAVGAEGSPVRDGSTERAPDIGYIGQIARSAEQLGFDAALTPTSSWCDDGWVMASALTQVTERFRFLVALRPGLASPTLAAQMAATFQRVSGGRLLLNVVTGGDDREQQRVGDHLGHGEGDHPDDRAAVVGGAVGGLRRHPLPGCRCSDHLSPGVARAVLRRLLGRRHRGR